MVVLGLVGLLAATALAPAANAAVLGLREVGTGLTEINAGPGQSVSLELYLDTEGLGFEGYLVGVDIDALGDGVVEVVGRA